MAMTLGIDNCKCIAKSFIAEAYKRKAGLGSNNYRNNLKNYLISDMSSTKDILHQQHHDYKHYNSINVHISTNHDSINLINHHYS
jgi:hypothetical protein